MTSLTLSNSLAMICWSFRVKYQVFFVVLKVCYCCFQLDYLHCSQCCPSIVLYFITKWSWIRILGKKKKKKNRQKNTTNFGWTFSCIEMYTQPTLCNVFIELIAHWTLDNGEHVALASLDLSAAFDTVHVKLMLTSLRIMGMSNNLELCLFALK